MGKRQIKEQGLYEKMKREIKILKNQFMHPNIVKVYDFIDTKSDLYIICELLEDELFEYITSKDKVSPSHLDESNILFQSFRSTKETAESGSSN